MHRTIPAELSVRVGLSYFQVNMGFYHYLSGKIVTFAFGDSRSIWSCWQRRKKILV
jgi:hypothetical protein